MTRSNVEEYADRSETLIDKSPQMNEQNVRDKLIRPLIEILGWDLYLDVESEYTVQIGTTQTRVDYALLIDDTPDVLIEAKSNGEALNGDHKGQLASYMRQAGTDWGLLTNGEKFQILKLKSGTSSSKEMVLAEVDLREINQDWEIMEIISKEMVQSGEAHQLADQLDTRKQAIQKLRENKGEIATEITDVIVDRTSDTLLQDLTVATDEFIDNLINDLDTEPSNEEVPNTVDEVLDALGTTLPGRTEEVRRNRAAVILSAFEFLRKQETASRDEIQRHLTKQYPNKFAEDGSEFDRHWVNYIRDELSELPRIEQPARGATQIWRYVPSDLDQKIFVSEIDDWILDLNNITSGNDESMERQRAVIQQIYDYLKENEKATKDDFEEVIPPYTAHYLDFEGFWSYCLRDALVAADDVDKPTTGHQYWYYIGGDGALSEIDVDIDDWVFEQEIPGKDFTKKRRQVLLQFAYDYLQDEKQAKRADFEKHFQSNIPKQTGRYRNFDGLWTYLLKDSLKNAPDVIAEDSGQRGPTTYKYTA